MDLTPGPREDQERSEERRPGCPECAPGAANPYDEPDLPHIHLTSYGYLIYGPTHEHCDFLEEMRAVAYRAGYGQGRDDEVAGKDMPSWT